MSDVERMRAEGMRRADADVPASVRRVEGVISGLLRVGVGVSLGIVVVGMVVSFVHHPGYLWSGKALPALTMPGRGAVHTVGAIVEGVKAGRGQALVMVGLLLLIATPVMRVGVSIVAFMVARDWVFAVITAVVFGLLLLAFLLGRAGG